MLDIGLFLKFYVFGANSGKILCVSLTFGLLQCKMQRLNQFTRACIIKNNYNGNAHFLVIKKKDQSLTRHQREMILMEIEWKKKLERSLFSLFFNSQKQRYWILSLGILDFDFFALIITKSNLFNFF